MIKSRGWQWASHVACMGEMRNLYKILVSKLEGKRQLGSWWALVNMFQVP